MKSKLSDLYKGFLIGLIVTIPGFSIGTLAIILNIYERLINDFSDIIKHPWQIIKKDILLLVGFIVGFIIDIIVVSYLLEHYPIQTVSFFVGLVITSIPTILMNGIQSKQKENRSFKNFIFEGITCFVCLGVLIFVTLLNSGEARIVELSFTYVLAMVLSGAIGAGFMIIPGISGSLIVLAIGYYDCIISSLKGLGSSIIHLNTNGLFVNSISVLSFAIGAMVGIIAISKLLKKLLEKIPSYLYFGILGLLIGSPFSIYFLTISKYEVNWNNSIMYIISGLMLILGIAFGMFAAKLEKKNQKLNGMKDER